MRSTAVASRYAKALMELAVEQGNLDSVAGDMNFLSEAGEGSHDFELLIASPLVRGDKKIKIFEKIFDQFEESTMAFIRLITKNRREYLLLEIAASFGRQVKEHKGIVPVTLISAHKLDDSSKNLILDKVSSVINGAPEIKEEIDESIIGGFIVRVGDTQINASVASQLDNLKQRLTR
jgi:F-type H+-transporting ATPase subunit delta